MHDALRAMNRIAADHVIETYAIGGGIGAAFHIDAQQTEDLDVFVILPPTASGLLTLSPIYDALKAQGGTPEGQYLRFGVWPVQILPDASELVTEAIRQAEPVDFDGVPTRVFTAEHLCAIALQVGRPKDDLRVELFLEQGMVDRDRLVKVAERFGLLDRWQRIASRRALQGLKS